MLVIIFLGRVARYYHPDTGFTSLIGFPAGHEYEAPALRDIPHYGYEAAGIYDGQFYAQRALDPLVRDAQVDRAMDLAPFRARRILFSWTAYVAGLGRPRWILEVFALQNVVAWLLLAFLLARWLSPATPRGLAAWTACLFSHGLLWSVRFSLLDGPSLMLTALALTLAENNRPLLSAAVVGINGLGRETNVLGVLAQPLVPPQRWTRLIAGALLVVLPILVWEDYLRSIYRSTIFAGVEGQTTAPGVAMVLTFARLWNSLRVQGLVSGAGLGLCLTLPLVVQAAFLVVRPRIREPWWRVALGYAALMLMLDRVLWDPSTGAVTRVMLPLTVGFNVFLLRERPRSFWPWFAAGNAHLIPALWVL